MNPSTELSDTIRKWLIVKPRPEIVRVITSDGEEDISTTGNVRWRAIANTIEALDPLRIEAHIAGKLERAIKLGKPEVEHSTAEAGEIPAILHDDPETARFTHFSNLIAAHSKFTITTAFEKQNELVGMMMEMMKSMQAQVIESQRDYQDVQDERIQEAMNRAGEDGDSGKMAIIENFVAGMTGMGGGAPPPKPNGAKKPS